MTTDQRRTGQISAEERELRIQLAAAYRLADKYGMSELIYTHISLRVPGSTPAYLLNPYGMLFHEITASSLMKLDFAGNIAGPTEWPVNRAGVAIHGSILAARPDVNCVFHTHTPYTTAVSALECGLLPMSQAALRFQGQIAYHDYGRAATDAAEGARLVKDMADKPVMILRNHGGITTGKTVGEAFVASDYLEKRVSSSSSHSRQVRRWSCQPTKSSPHPAADRRATSAPGPASFACSTARIPSYRE